MKLKQHWGSELLAQACLRLQSLGSHHTDSCELSHFNINPLQQNK